MHRFIWIAASLLLLACDSNPGKVATSPSPTVGRLAAAETPVSPTQAPAAAATEETPAPAIAPTPGPAQPLPTMASISAPTRPAGPIVVSLRALNLAFSAQTLRVPAGVPVTLVLENEDVSVAHDIGVSLPGVGLSEACSGPCTTSVAFTAQAAGRYDFFCSIHPDMVGDLIVTP